MKSLLPEGTPVSPNSTVSWLLPLATFEKPENSAGASEQVLLQTAILAPLLRKFWNGAYI